MVFPDAARREAGFQLDRVQNGREPADWKPMPAIGAGVREIRIGDARGAFRVVYVAKFEEAVFVLHCFQKKSQRTSREGHRARGAPVQGIGQGIEVMSGKRFASVWDAIESDPTTAENMKLRSGLMMALSDHIEREGLSQAQAAKLLDVTQPRISDLVRGKIELFSIDALVNMLAAAGLHVDMKIARSSPRSSRRGA